MMIYDQTTIAFIQKSEKMMRTILSEMGIAVNRSRFEWQRYLYPIQVVVFEGGSWGFFNAAFLQVGLNKKLIYLAKDSVIRDVLKHELAHYLTFLEFGEVSHHGQEFHSICDRFSFPREIASATMNLELANESKEGDLTSERVIEKVKKLLLLAQSSNVHEAELATLKANQLLLRHNIENLEVHDDQPIYLDRILFQTRKDAKLSAIYDILRHFVVRPVISFGKNTCCLEVSGSLTNVKLARYVAEFLHREMDHLWDETKKEHQLQGLRAKNSFFLGMAKGFDEKMKKTKSEFSPIDQKSLLVVEKKLTESTKIIYRRLSHSSPGNVMDERANSLGIQKGKDLTIRQGVEGQGKKLSLPWVK